MKISDFKHLIRELPFRNQSFDIKRKNWKIISQVENLDKIFKNSDTININRFDLECSKGNIREFILKTLMWGYPTKGRGSNIDKILEIQNFRQLTEILEDYRDNEISISRLKNDIKSINGLGLSTITKFTHFLNTKIEGNKAVILDVQIIGAINTGRFEEFNSLRGISYTNAPNRYLTYLKKVNDLSKTIKAEPDQIEMFLFTFGRGLSELKEDANFKSSKK